MPCGHPYRSHQVAKHISHLSPKAPTCLVSWYIGCSARCRQHVPVYEDAISAKLIPTDAPCQPGAEYPRDPPDLYERPSYPDHVTQVLTLPPQKHLRHFLYSDHYFPPLNGSQSEDLRVHLDHRLEVLRAAAMCRADDTPFTLLWGRSRSPQANHSGLHRCVKWDDVQSWSKARNVQRLTEPGALKHPRFGDVVHGDDSYLDRLIGVANPV